VREDADVVR